MSRDHRRTDMHAASKDVLTFDTVSAGLHCSLRMSKQMLPLLLTAPGDVTSKGSAPALEVKMVASEWH